MSRTIKLNYTTYALPDDWKQSEVNTFVALVAQLHDTNCVNPNTPKHDVISPYDYQTMYVASPVNVSLDLRDDAVYYSSKSAAQHDVNKTYKLAIDIHESEENSNV
jgi:hypothetical protein